MSATEEAAHFSGGRLSLQYAARPLSDNALRWGRSQALPYEFLEVAQLLRFDAVSEIAGDARDWDRPGGRWDVFDDYLAGGRVLRAGIKDAKQREPITDVQIAILARVAALIKKADWRTAGAGETGGVDHELRTALIVAGERRGCDAASEDREIVGIIPNADRIRQAYVIGSPHAVVAIISS